MILVDIIPWAIGQLGEAMWFVRNLYQVNFPVVSQYLTLVPAQSWLAVLIFKALLSYWLIMIPERLAYRGRGRGNGLGWLDLSVWRQYWLHAKPTCFMFPLTRRRGWTASVSMLGMGRLTPFQCWIPADGCALFQYQIFYLLNLSMLSHPNLVMALDNGNSVFFTGRWGL